MSFEKVGQEQKYEGLWATIFGFSANPLSAQSILKYLVVKSLAKHIKARVPLFGCCYRKTGLLRLKQGLDFVTSESSWSILSGVWLSKAIIWYLGTLDNYAGLFPGDLVGLHRLIKLDPYMGR